jgi:hypothetical protein
MQVQPADLLRDGGVSSKNINTAFCSLHMAAWGGFLNVDQTGRIDALGDIISLVICVMLQDY